jgi:hypothetical protein
MILPIGGHKRLIVVVDDGALGKTISLSLYYLSYLSGEFCRGIRTDLVRT